MRVVIRWVGPDDLPEIYSDEGVEVFTISEFAPQDRIYRTENPPIPDGMLDGPIGFAGDGSAAAARVEKWVREFKGDQPFDVIKGGRDA